MSREIFELKCLTDLEEVSSVALYIGLLAIPLCFITPLPQYYKLFKRGSAAGFSSLMLFIGNLGRALNVINLFILHYDQVQLCFSKPGMLLKCQPSLLVLYSGLTGFLSMFPLYLVVMLMSNRRSTALPGHSGGPQHKMLWLGLIVQVVIIGLAASPIINLLQVGRCKPFQVYANIVGFFNTIFLCTQFVPQIVLTWTRKEGGAVSYMMYFPDVIGGYIMTAEKAFGTHERISTWLPYALMHTLELFMLILNAVYDESFRAWIRENVRIQKTKPHYADDYSELEDANTFKAEEEELEIG